MRALYLASGVWALALLDRRRAAAAGPRWRRLAWPAARWTALASAHVALVMGSAFGAEGYARLSFATSLGVLERGFDALSALVTGVPAKAIDYADTDAAVALVEELWAQLP